MVAFINLDLLTHFSAPRPLRFSSLSFIVTHRVSAVVRPQMICTVTQRVASRTPCTATAELQLTTEQQWETNWPFGHKKAPQGNLWPVTCAPVSREVSMAFEAEQLRSEEKRRAILHGLMFKCQWLAPLTAIVYMAVSNSTFTTQLHLHNSSAPLSAAHGLHSRLPSCTLCPAWLGCVHEVDSEWTVRNANTVSYWYIPECPSDCAACPFLSSSSVQPVLVVQWKSYAAERQWSRPRLFPIQREKTKHGETVGLPNASVETGSVSPSVPQHVFLLDTEPIRNQGHNSSLVWLFFFYPSTECMSTECPVTSLL